MRSKSHLPAPERPITPTSWPVGQPAILVDGALVAKTLGAALQRSTRYPSRSFLLRWVAAAGCTKATVRLQNRHRPAAERPPWDKVLGCDSGGLYGFHSVRSAIHMDGLARDVARTGRGYRLLWRRLLPSSVAADMGELAHLRHAIARSAAWASASFSIRPRPTHSPWPPPIREDPEMARAEVLDTRPWPRPRRGTSAGRGHRRGPRGTTRRPGGRWRQVHQPRPGGCRHREGRGHGRHALSPAARRGADGAAVGETGVAHHDVELAEAAAVSSTSGARCRAGETPSTTSALPSAGSVHGLGDLVGARAAPAGTWRDGGIGRSERTSGGGADAGRAAAEGTGLSSGG